MKELNEKELCEISGGSFLLIVAGLAAVAAGVMSGVAVADYYMNK